MRRLVNTLADALQADAQLVAILQDSLRAEPSSILREGGVIADGYDAELDELRGIQTNCGDFLLALEARERARTGIATLKVEYNRVHGFYIEVSQAQCVNVPDDYRRRQTLKNAERYITPELKTFEDKALSANERALAREKFLYEQLLDQLAPFIPQLQRIAAAIAELDVLATFAERAATLNFSAPQFSDETQIGIIQGRHPVVEAQVDIFTPNDTTLNEKRRMLLITGPNMGGKSTYMRQVALIALLAHCGCFVPAQSSRARRDRPDLYAHRRIGRPRQRPLHLHGRDDRGRQHPAQRHREKPGAGGRDRARHEHLRRPRPRLRDRAPPAGKEPQLHAVRHPLFRTDAAVGRIPATANVHLTAIEHQHSIVFLHSVNEGAASQSYGLQVAALAGVPNDVIRAAKKQLRTLEQNSAAQNPQGDLFDHKAVVEPEKPEEHPLLQSLRDLQPDELSPKEALEKIYQLKRMV